MTKTGTSMVLPASIQWIVISKSCRALVFVPLPKPPFPIIFCGVLCRHLHGDRWNSLQSPKRTPYRPIQRTLAGGWTNIASLVVSDPTAAIHPPETGRGGDMDVLCRFDLWNFPQNKGGKQPIQMPNMALVAHGNISCNQSWPKLSTTRVLWPASA